jgi:eukaryotic-like serine/threonine-protein kinase
VSALAVSPSRPRALRVEDLGELLPVSRAGGQGRVYRPAASPAVFGQAPVVVKLYRRSPPECAAGVLAEMVTWAGSMNAPQRASLDAIAAWPLALVWAGRRLAGIVMRDVSERFAAPFLMPSGRRERVLLTLEHLLGGDDFLQLRGLGVRLDTALRARVAERVCAGLAFLHRNAIAASDIAPNNLLVAFRGLDTPAICFIDCDSMVFRGRQALASVQTGDWDIPAGFAEAPSTRAADAYKLGLLILRLFARSHDARTSAPYLRYIPVELRDLLERALGADSLNRPPAGEWQRALRGVVADGRVGARYPAPAPATRPAPRAGAPPRQVAPERARIRVPAASAPAAAAMPAAPATTRSNGTSGLWLRRAVVVMWLVAGTMVLAVLLSRLFASAVPVPGNGGYGPGANQSVPYTYQYYYPPGRDESVSPGAQLH